MKKYEHIISLGFLCSVAQELERIGLRDSSGPFDWLISDFQGVLNLIDNGFEDFLNINFMQQYANNPDLFMNRRYDIHFYHDFNKYKSCKEQIEEVSLKYQRRIDRFYNNIQEPTLFMRYIKNQDEYDFIEQNLDKILASLCNYNKENNILFISNDNIVGSNINKYIVKPDDGDTVSRLFLEKNSELKGYLSSNIYNEKKRVSNNIVYRRKILRKKLLRYPYEYISSLKKIFHKIKIHDSLYFTDDHADVHSRSLANDSQEGQIP